MMQEFKADCTINLRLDDGGRQGKYSWSCELDIGGKKIVTAKRFLGAVSRAEAEAGVVLFGLRQAQRLLQEKVELHANFPVEGIAEKKAFTSRGRGPDLQSERNEIAQLWAGFRLKRIGPAKAVHVNGGKEKFRRHREPKLKG